MVSKLRIAVSIVFLGILAFLLSRLDLQAVYTTINKANKLYLVIASLVFIVMVFLKIQKLTMISRYYSHSMSFKQASLVQMVGIAIATLTPGRVGEGSKLILMKRHLGMPLSSSVRIIVLERLLDIIVLSAGAFLLSIYIIENMVVLTGLFFFIIVAVLLVFMKRPTMFRAIVPRKYKEHLSIEIKNDRALFALISASTFAIWATEALFQWFVLLSFDTHVPFFIVFGIFCISTIAVFFTVLPAGFGSVELSYFFLYPRVGVPIEVAAALILIHRLFSLSFPYISSALVLNYYKLSPGDLRREMKE